MGNQTTYKAKWETVYRSALNDIVDDFNNKLGGTSISDGLFWDSVVLKIKFEGRTHNYTLSQDNFSVDCLKAAVSEGGENKYGGEATQ